MPKYAIFFSYTSGTRARMISTPGDRTAAIRQLPDSLGGSLESVTGCSGPTTGSSSPMSPTR